ncbi:MAG: catalase HPII, partial [Gemmatimonadaceae bacterium]
MTNKKNATGSSKKSAVPGHQHDAVGQQAKDVEATASAIPHNSNKPGEVGRENAINPPEGASVEPASEQVGASTLSETNYSAKTGETGIARGTDATLGVLDRARVDNTGQRLT